jgi:TrmH family RNA methyltransferase
MAITSLKNDKVRLVRALQTRRRARQREGLFVVEGVRLCEEADRTGLAVHFALYTEQASEGPRAAALLSSWAEAGVSRYEVSESVMAACSDTESPQGLLAVVPIPSLPAPESPTLTLVLDRLRDPGNLGTLLRTALAAGVDQVLLLPGTVDPTNPKVVRGGAGAHFWLPISMVGWDGLERAIAGCRAVLSTPGGGVDYAEFDWREPVALVVGGEAAGAGERVRSSVDLTVSIPMADGVESLNVAAATAVLLFEAVRQRRGLP